MYSFEIFEGVLSKGCFVRVYEKKLTLSSNVIKKVGRKISVYLDKNSNAIMIKPDENGRSVSLLTTSFTISGKSEMPIGRYFLCEENEGSFIFKK